MAPGGWYVIVSHIHPSTTEGAELMAETLVPALQDASSVPGGQEEAFFWTVDVHCGDVDDSEGDSDGGPDSAGVAGGRDTIDGRAGDGGGAADQIGPSAYMARKVNDWRFVFRPTGGPRSAFCRLK